MWYDDISEVINTIRSMKQRRINQDKILWLSYDLLDYYEEFKVDILHYLGDNASIYIDKIPRNMYYVVFKVDDLYFPLYPLRDSDPNQVMNLSCSLSADEFNNLINN